MEKQADGPETSVDADSGSMGPGRRIYIRRHDDVLQEGARGEGEF